MAGIMSGEHCANLFKNPQRQASANYCIGVNGDIVANADETTQRAWTSGSDWNDQKSVTIEVSNDKLGGNWSISKKSYEALINLCADICDRNNINPHYTGDKSGSLTEHRMFQATACPGTYIHGLLASEKIEKDIKSRMKSETGWIKNKTGWWYKRSDGTYPKNEWEKINGKWYHFDSKGYMQIGFINLKGKWYYLADNGAMVTGKNKPVKASFNSNGELIG